MADGRELIAVALGGAVGALARTALAEVGAVDPGDWPWTTFLANVVGTALLAHTVTRLQERMPPSRELRPLLGTGLCGALTTFSTLQVEVLWMLDAGRTVGAATYVTTSVGAGLLMALLLTRIARGTR